MEMAGDELRLDGNAAGGALGEVFAFETTTAEVVCGGCGALAPLGTALVYRHGMGTVVRCAACDHVLVRVATIRGRVWLDLRGAVSIAAQRDPTGDP